MQAISVSQYNEHIKNIFDVEELLHNIKIVGEVFGISTSRNVIYFSLKDENSAISCVCFYGELFDEIKEGDKVTVTGSPNYYMKSGKLSFNVTKFEKAEKGNLFQKFIELKNQLEKEGLFLEDHKKPMPKEIKRIGVITSKEGAVIHDIINVATRRNPSIDILYFPVKVQGKGAENEIALAIQKLSSYKEIDVIVVARGGGSLEDLWAYNTEIVARATYNCEKPIVSAVGHETDFTIIDFVSDLRAPTPSAAAELLTVDTGSRKEKLSTLFTNFNNTLKRFSKNLEQETSSLSKAFLGVMTNYVQAKDYELGLLDNSLKNLDPLAVLKRGYAKLEQNGNMVDKIGSVDLKSNLEVFLQDGKVIATPLEILGDEKWNTKRW